MAEPFKVVPIAGAWYPVCFVRELRNKPVAVTLFGDPLVLFRDATGTAAALSDRCPHRNVPLSLGRVHNGLLQCAYHGWSFDGRGACKEVPSLCGRSEHVGRRAETRPCVERDGLVWVRTQGESVLDDAPVPLRHAQDRDYLVIQQTLDFDGPMDAAVENALDVPHTAFLHAGLFRQASARHQVEAVVRRLPDRVEAEFIGEKPPTGVLGRILAAGSGPMFHCDRFIAPCLAQVEYRLGQRSHVIANAAFCPVDQDRTKMLATVSVRTPGPTALLEPIVKPLALRILRQDADIIGEQTRNIARFGQERFVSTEVDLVGPAVRSLLTTLHQGQRPEARPEKRVTMMV